MTEVILTAQTMAKATRNVYDLLTGDEDARVCKNIPEEQCRHQPRNFILQLTSQTLTKISDGLADAKLILAWLMSSLGAPGFLVGLLVPLRESLSLVPQMVIAGVIRRLPVRKWIWIAGALGQATALLAMSVVALTMNDASAGWAIIGLLTVFSLARGVNSVASKDVMGKTVSKSRRGTLSGYATSAAGLVVGGLGLYLVLFQSTDQSAGFFALILALAAALWLLAVASYTMLAEAPGATEGGANAIDEARRQLRLLKTDQVFRSFVITRALLLSTALVAPFYVALAQQSGRGALSDLGMLVIASGLAGALSASVWGRLADRSSRMVLVCSAGLAALLGSFVVVSETMGLAWVQSVAFYPFVIFVLAIAHAGVRLGRKTYLIDMATAETRASYVAVSNTVIGILLLAGGVFGLLADTCGQIVVIALLSALSAAGAFGAFALKEQA